MSRDSFDNEDSNYSSRKHPQDREESFLENPLGLLKRPWARMVVGALALSPLIPNWFASPFYTNSGNEMSGHTRLGKVISTEPAGPGFHCKIPVIDGIDKIETSKQLRNIEMTQGTIDNQTVTIQASVEYKIPPEAVLYLLYDVGKVGKSDVGERIEDTVKGDTRILIGQQNTSDINGKSGMLANQMFETLHTDLRNQYRVEITKYNFMKMDPSDSWKASNEFAMQSKSHALAEANNIAMAKAVGDQHRATADADAYVQRTKADSQAYESRITGEGIAAGIKAERSMFASDAAYNQYITAKVWNGQLPAVTGGNGVPLLQGILPTGGGKLSGLKNQ